VVVHIPELVEERINIPISSKWRASPAELSLTVLEKLNKKNKPL